MDLTHKPHFGVTFEPIDSILVSHRKDQIMSEFRSYRSLDEWLVIIQEARKSCMTDAQWCLANGIKYETFKTAIKRLKKCSYTIPSKSPRDIYDLTSTKQDVVKVDIVPDVLPPKDTLPEVAPHFDNSHMIEITFGDIHISLCNGADPVLVSKTLSLLRSYS